MENSDIKGYIGFFKIEDFWLSVLKEEHRSKVMNSLPDKSEGLGLISKESLLYSNITGSSATKIAIMGIIFCIVDSDLEVVEEHILNYIEGQCIDSKSMVDLHFMFQTLIEQNYKKRENNLYLNKSKEYCVKQINISEKVVKIFKEEDGEDVLLQLK